MNGIDEKILDLIEKSNKLMQENKSIDKTSFTLVNSIKGSVPIAINLLNIADSIVVLIGGFGVAFEAYEIHPYESYEAEEILNLVDRIVLILKYYNKNIGEIDIVNKDIKYIEDENISDINEIATTLADKISSAINNNFDKYLEEKRDELRNRFLNDTKKNIFDSYNLNLE